MHKRGQMFIGRFTVTQAQGQGPQNEMRLGPARGGRHGPQPQLVGCPGVIGQSLAGPQIAVGRREQSLGRVGIQLQGAGKVDVHLIGVVSGIAQGAAQLHLGHGAFGMLIEILAPLSGEGLAVFLVQPAIAPRNDFLRHAWQQRRSRRRAR